MRRRADTIVTAVKKKTKYDNRCYYYYNVRIFNIAYRPLNTSAENYNYLIKTTREKNKNEERAIIVGRY